LRVSGTTSNSTSAMFKICYAAPLLSVIIQYALSATQLVFQLLSSFGCFLINCIVSNVNVSKAHSLSGHIIPSHLHSEVQSLNSLEYWH